MKTKCSKPAGVLPLAISVAGLILILWPTTGQCQRSWRQADQPAAAEDPNAPVQPNSWASFNIILQRNIFSRQRRAYRPVEAREERPAAPTPNPESYFVLKGVVQQNDEFIAFIENTQLGTVLRLRRGDPVARGTIKTLTLDGLEYQMEDKTTVVRVGLDLEGGHGVLTTRQMLDLAAMPAAPSGSSPSSGSSTPSSGDDAEILKRLMEKRKQQIGQ